MNHRDVIARIPPARLAWLSQRTDGPGLRHLAGHVALIGALGIWVGAGWPFWPLALAPLGVALVFLFTLEHEATHQTPFANRALNEWVGRGCGLILLLPFEWFRAFHLAHHRHTNIPGRDPELEGGKPETWRAYLLHISGLPVWAGQVRQLWRNAKGADPAPFVPRRAQPRIAREARIMLGIYAVAAASFTVTPLLLWVWIVPLLLGQPVLRLYLLAEHGRCAYVANMLENTRTTFTNRLVRYLAWNMPYHTEHHVLPAVPFHRLPALHAEMRDALGVTASGYAAFTADYARSLSGGSTLAEDRPAG